jgi:hypothetical protein
LNTTLNTNLTDRPRQTILIDVGEEEDPKMHMIIAAREVYERLSAQGSTFRAEEDLWFHAYTGQPHSFESWIGRAWSALSVLSKDRAYP